MPNPPSNGAPSWATPLSADGTKKFSPIGVKPRGLLKFAMDICPTSWATSFPGVVTLTIPVVETFILVASAGN